MDRNFGDVQYNPDGTKHSIYYGNNTVSSGGVIDGRLSEKARDGRAATMQEVFTVHRHGQKKSSISPEEIDELVENVNSL